MPRKPQTYANTGFGPVDLEHGVLSLALDDFAHTVTGDDVGKIRAELDSNLRAVVDHFDHEEEWMARAAYPLAEPHAAAHAAFVADARKAAQGLAGGVSPDFRRWAFQRLPGWFRLQILKHDMGLGQFLVRAGARSPGPRVEA